MQIHVLFNFRSRLFFSGVVCQWALKSTLKVAVTFFLVYCKIYVNQIRICSVFFGNLLALF